MPGAVGFKGLTSGTGVKIIRVDDNTFDPLRNATGQCIECKIGEAGEVLKKIDESTPFLGYTDKNQTEKKVLES